MAWSDIAWIVVACTSANHLGLIAAVESLLHRRLPVVSCPKCLTFWSTLAYLLACFLVGDDAPLRGGTIAAYLPAVPRMLAVSFLAAYSALWLELIMYFIDTIYNSIYDQISKDNREETDGEVTSKD
jgi:hypothetical protein